MTALAIAAATTVVVLVVLLVRPWRLAIALEARGEPDGRWAVAGGAEVFGLSASLAAARGVAAVTDVRILGRRLRPRPPSSSDDRPRNDPIDSLQRRYARLERWVDPVDLSAFLVSETRRITIHDVDGRILVGVRDVALAGQIAGLLAMASALAAPFGRLRHEIDWSGEERLDASVSLALRFSPALLLADAARFAVRSILFRRNDARGS